MERKTSKTENVLSLLLWLLGMFWLDTPKAAVLMLFAVTLHEMGHLCAFLLMGEPLPGLGAQRLGLRLFEARPLSYKREALAALAGPFANLLCFSFSWLLGKAGLGAYLHLFLAIGNLLPIETLDGGRVLEGILGTYFDAKTVYGVCRAVSFLTLCIALFFALVFLWARGSGAYLFFLFFSLFVRHLTMSDACIDFRRI
ncbi:MAG: hypothetical protein J6R40_01570 [Clostridia bacterium]|nr:hypothetical protein [Clostridia bacterium]